MPSTRSDSYANRNTGTSYPSDIKASFKFKSKPELDGNNKYILAIEQHKCSEDISNFCIYKKFDGCTLNQCPYPMRENPLCMCGDWSDCPKLFRVKKHKDSRYIFYQCDKCDKFLRNFKGAVKSILEPLQSKYIFYGDNLKKLVKDVFKDTEEITDLEDTIKYFVKVYNSIGFRV